MKPLLAATAAFAMLLTRRRPRQRPVGRFPRERPPVVPIPDAARQSPPCPAAARRDAFEADTFEVEGDHYIAIITDGKGVIPNGTRVAVPNQKMKWDAGNPTGHGIVFIGTNGQLYCYVAPGGV